MLYIEHPVYNTRAYAVRGYNAGIDDRKHKKNRVINYDLKIKQS